MNIFLLFSLFQALFTRGAELASRSDTGLRKQTGEGEAFTGGRDVLPAKKMESVPIFRPFFANTEQSLPEASDFLEFVYRLAKTDLLGVFKLIAPCDTGMGSFERVVSQSLDH